MFNKSKDKCSLDKRLQTFHFEFRLENMLHWQSIMTVVCTGGGGGSFSLFIGQWAFDRCIPVLPGSLTSLYDLHLVLQQTPFSQYLN